MEAHRFFYRNIYQIFWYAIAILVGLKSDQFDLIHMTYVCSFTKSEIYIHVFLTFLRILFPREARLKIERRELVLSFCRGPQMRLFRLWLCGWTSVSQPFVNRFCSGLLQSMSYLNISGPLFFKIRSPLLARAKKPQNLVILHSKLKIRVCPGINFLTTEPILMLSPVIGTLPKYPGSFFDSF